MSILPLLLKFMVVMDDDGNGLVKIKEVNEFVDSKPEDTSLMEWIAYSAYGDDAIPHISFTTHNRRNRLGRQHAHLSTPAGMDYGTHDRCRLR